MDNSNSNYELEPVAKALAATAISQSLSFCMERKYLQGIDRGEMFSLFFSPSSTDSGVSWIAVNQVGRPLEKSAESCFTAIQKILYSCFLPKELQLLFLVVGNNKENHMYLGLRSPGAVSPPKNLMRNLNEFLKGIWPGLETAIEDDSGKTSEQFAALEKFRQEITKVEDFI